MAIQLINTFYCFTTRLRTFLIVSTPLPLSLDVVTRGGSPMCPQLSLQMMRGVGTPIASHVITTVSPCCTVILGGGPCLIVGEPEEQNKVHVCHLIFNSAIS